MKSWLRRHGSEIIVGLIIAGVAGAFGLVVRELGPTGPDPTDGPSTTPTSSIPSPTEPKPTDPAPTDPPPTREPTFLEQLNGSWTLVDWRERTPEGVSLGMDLLNGTMVVDDIGHAIWDVDIDDGGPPPRFTPGVSCLGVLDPGSKEMEGVPGRLVVNGEDLLGDQRDWARNLLSLRGDAEVAFCGWTYQPSSELFVFGTANSRYGLAISTAADEDGTLLLAMQNVAGVFTWKKDR